MAVSFEGRKKLNRRHPGASTIDQNRAEVFGSLLRESIDAGQWGTAQRELSNVKDQESQVLTLGAMTLAALKSWVILSYEGPRFLSVVVIKHPDQEQRRREKGVYLTDAPVTVGK